VAKRNKKATAAAAAHPALIDLIPVAQPVEGQAGEPEDAAGDEGKQKKKKKKSSKKDKEPQQQKKRAKNEDDERDFMGIGRADRTSKADIRSREVDVHDDNYEEVTRQAKLEYSERYKLMHISHSLTNAARHFLKQILRVEVHKRLGCGPDAWEDVKRHEFFEGINWDKMASRELKAPIQPDPDVSNCSNTAYALDVLGGGPKPKKISPEQQKQFDRWAFNTDLPPPGTVVKKVPISRRI